MTDYEKLPLFISPKQMAEITGQLENSIRRGILQGKIPADKVGGRWMICRDLVFPATEEAYKNARG